MRDKLKKCSLKYILVSTVIIFIVGSMFHFIFDWFGKNIIIGLIAPVNESVWEHCKMVVLPIILWWIIYYICIKKSNSINKQKWFTAMIISLLVSIITIPLLFYFYTESFGIESVIIDIFILFLAVLAGQSLACHYYRRSYRYLNQYVSISISVVVVIIFMIFTVYTPKIPLFMDTSNQTYGIQK